ncbi:MAG: hydrogenase 4 subunit B [Acidobacteria bacterium]|nr:hydrogenase 4 subunit B [Acidobacteriota bacterium]
MSLLNVFATGLTFYVVAAVCGMIAALSKRDGRTLVCLTCVAGAAFEAVAALRVLLAGDTLYWSFTAGIPNFAYSFQIDPLAAFFLLALSALAIPISIYSLARPHLASTATPFQLFYALLLLSITLVFSASNVMTFLLAWEGMVLTAYCMVVSAHEENEVRRGGLLYILMSRGGTGFLFLGFLFLSLGSGSMEFASFHNAGMRMEPSFGAATFLLLFAGFGIKAGVIPLHIWLPAAHPVAPSNISALMSGILIKTGIYGMARVFFDFYGEPPVWAGMLVLSLGVVSALLGVLYALMEHDLKRLLAFHSIENIGIILIGFGAALLFRSFGQPKLAALALVAGLFHTLNHGVFKALLFLGAGSVLHATHTRNMEEMGGLIRRMPSTALYFLIGAVAISGLPPLNGFVSEWLTYQALLAGFGVTETLTRMAFPIAGALLALTAALAAACFVKAFGITFLALPRSEHAAEAREVPGTMRAAMAILAVFCAGLGLGATWFLQVFDPITQQAFGVSASPAMVLNSGLALAAGPGAGTVSLLGIAVFLIALLAVPVLLRSVWKPIGRPSHGPTWDCGLPGLTAANEYTATAFSKPLRMIFSALFRPRREILTEFDVSPYYPTAIRFESEIQPAFEKHFYDPLKSGILTMAKRMRGIQAGSVHAYLAYIFVTLIALLLFGVRE